MKDGGPIAAQSDERFHGFIKQTLLSWQRFCDQARFTQLKDVLVPHGPVIKVVPPLTITYVLGTTCVGKSTLVDVAKKLYPRSVHVIQVGKELRRRYSAEDFKGLGALTELEHEVADIITAGVQSAQAAKIPHVLIDGNPRAVHQLYLLKQFPQVPSRIWWVNADEAQANEWAHIRCEHDPAGLQLALQRRVNDCVQLYPLIFELGCRAEPSPIEYVCMHAEFDYTSFFRKHFGLPGLDEREEDTSDAKD